MLTSAKGTAVPGTGPGATSRDHDGSNGTCSVLFESDRTVRVPLDTYPLDRRP